MVLNFLTKRLTQEQRNNFFETCRDYVDDDIVVNVEDVEQSYTFIISMFNKGNNFRCFYFIMCECDFDFIAYAYMKLLQAGSQICKLHNTITQIIND